jgi:alkylated DNA repair dioxygenase AlkB
MRAPVLYYPNFVADPDAAFARLRDDLDWERRSDAPRCEYYCNDVRQPYVYGVGRGRRLYEPRPYHPAISEIRRKLEQLVGVTFEVCFLNRYLNQSDHLGWHADDSPEMDDARPIASVSLGVSREIWFRRKPDMTADLARIEAGDTTPPGQITKFLLEHGSLCLMAPGMQDAWQHRVPKASFQCGERISLTFRGYVPAPVEPRQDDLAAGSSPAGSAALSDRNPR